MSDQRKINYITLFAGIFMILISVLNYLMNEDHVSLGIFAFLGLGFILLGIKSKFKASKAQRIKRYAMTFFFGAAVIIIYWLAVAKFHLF